MKLKTYCRPTMEIVMLDVIACQSVVNVSGNGLDQYGGAGDGTGYSAPNSKRRGIWEDE